MNDLRLLTPREINNEPRIRDIDLAERLGFEQARSIRTLIGRNRAELDTYGTIPYSRDDAEVSPHHGAKLNAGEVLHRSDAKPNKGGRPTVSYWLNEGQALLLCMFSQTARAAQVRKLVIDTFMDYRAGKIVHVKEHMRRPPLPGATLQYDFAMRQRLPGEPFVVQAIVTPELAMAMLTLWTERVKQPDLLS